MSMKLILAFRFFGFYVFLVLKDQLVSSLICGSKSFLIDFRFLKVLFESFIPFFSILKILILVSHWCFCYIYSAGFALIRAKYFMYRHRNSNVPTIFSNLAASEGTRTAFHYKDEKWSFQDIERFSNKLGNAFAKLGYVPGDEVALVMHSRPEYVGIWLGMAKNGIVTAFINTNQKLETLVHSVTVVNCKAVIFDMSLTKSE